MFAEKALATGERGSYSFYLKTMIEYEGEKNAKDFRFKCISY